MPGSVRAFRPGLTFAAALGFASAAVADAPMRVVSMNLCTDQLAMMLAAPGQLISVSRIARDPLTSPMHVVAQDYPINHGSAEEIFLLEPDLVLAGIYTDPAAVALLRRLGIEVAQIELVSNLEEVTERVAEIGALLGREDAAATQIATFEDALDVIRGHEGNGPLTAFYYPNGYTLGTETLSHEILSAAGFRHLAERLGQAYSGRLSLEQLVMEQPEMIISSTPYPGSSRSEAILNHPVLQTLTDPYGPHVSGPEWVCGTPHVLTALQELADAQEARQ